MIERKCVYCQLTDDHPKHEQVHQGWVSVYAHKDCCAEYANCPLCKPEVEFAAGKRGEEFRAAISEFYATKG